MRPRKVAAIAAEELPPPDLLMDAFPSDEAMLGDEPPSAVVELLGSERLCLDCGGSGGVRDGCAHLERVRFQAPSRAARELIARLRRAAAEHRAAARALRALVTTECARGQAEVETLAAKAPAAAEAPAVPTASAAQEIPAAPLPCPRCAAREAEPTEAPAPAPARRARRKVHAATEQQAFAFASDREPCALLERRTG